ncbi:hypothetical protein [Cognatiyoonia sp.]|uniref:hypothetical protein n=1 Tax=Cognatiyoonia sp. TaxID=2211652 RepID=UPI003F6A454E
MLKQLTYFIVFMTSLFAIHNYASSEIGSMAAGGSYFGGLIQGFLGGYGNTVPVLLALITSAIGIIRAQLGNSGGIGAMLSGKLLGVIIFIATWLSIFANGVLGYLKLDAAGATYVHLLGPVYVEGIICSLLIVGFFMSPKNQANSAE